jgi:uncharacterized protein (DUF2147 family)
MTPAAFRSIRLLSVLPLLLAPVARASSQTGIFGDFEGPTHSIVRVHPCGASVCLTLVKLPPNPPSVLDGHNPDEALQKRPLCGLDIGTGFRQQDADHLVDGQLYDPVSGKTYKGNVTGEGDKLKLRGYIGISLFGRSETWTRVPAVVPCT